MDGQNNIWIAIYHKYKTSVQVLHVYPQKATGCSILVRCLIYCMNATIMPLETLNRSRHSRSNRLFKLTWSRGAVNAYSIRNGNVAIEAFIDAATVLLPSPS